MSEFLADHLGVPKDHITELLAPEGGDISSHNYPTRQNILFNLWSLHQDERIRHGDIIIVFYAGHGAVYDSGAVLRGAVQVEECELDWNSFYQCNHIELDANRSGLFMDAIVPPDRGLPDSDPTYSGKTVPDICDRELNTIFAITRQKKGPNILFIADCGRAAPTDRRPPDVTTWRTRALPPLWYNAQEMVLRAQWNIDKYKVCIFPVVLLRIEVSSPLHTRTAYSAYKASWMSTGLPTCHLLSPSPRVVWTRRPRSISHRTTGFLQAFCWTRLKVTRLTKTRHLKG